MKFSIRSYRHHNDQNNKLCIASILFLFVLVITSLKISPQDAPGQPNYPKFKKCREKFNRECVEVQILHLIIVIKVFNYITNNLTLTDLQSSIHDMSCYHYLYNKIPHDYHSSGKEKWRLHQDGSVLWNSLSGINYQDDICRKGDCWICNNVKFKRKEMTK